MLWKKQVYSVGTSYFHGEARKSPTVDGKVERDETGKEACFWRPFLWFRFVIPFSWMHAKRRYVGRSVCCSSRPFVALTCSEKEDSPLCAMSMELGIFFLSFSMHSFVKKNRKFWADASHLIKLLIYKQLQPSLLTVFLIKKNFPPFS